MADPDTTTMNEDSWFQPEMLMAGYVLGDLSLEEAQSLEQFLADTPEAEVELAALQDASELTYGAITTPPAHLKEAIKEAILASDRRSSSQSSSINDLPFHRSAPAVRGFSIGIGALAAGLILALGIQNYTLRQTVQTLQAKTAQPADTEILTYYLVPTDNAQANSELRELEVVINPAQSEIVLKTELLPPLDDGQVYALWTVVAADAPITKDDKNAVLTAVFTAEEADSPLQSVTLLSAFREDIFRSQAPSPEGNGVAIEAVAVTIEDAASPQQHQSSPVWIQRL